LPGASILASLLLIYAYDRTRKRAGPTDEPGGIVKKLDVLAVTMAMAFVAVAFAGGVGTSGSEQRTHYCDPEYQGDLMGKGYQVPPSNEGE
jgi:hypothetical protein